MAIKKPVKTIKEAFAASCEKNDIKMHKRQKPRSSFKIKDKDNNVYVISPDLSVRKEEKVIKAKRELRAYAAMPLATMLPKSQQAKTRKMPTRKNGKDKKKSAYVKVKAEVEV